MYQEGLLSGGTIENFQCKRDEFREFFNKNLDNFTAQVYYKNKVQVIFYTRLHDTQPSTKMKLKK